MEYLGPRPEEEEGAPLWSLTFADLMSQLLAFFVLIASYSTMDVIKYRDLVGSVQTALGTRDRTLDDAQLDSAPTQGIASAAEERERRWVEREVEAIAKEVGGPLQMLQTADGTRIRIEGAVLFDPGQATIRPEGLPLLDKLGPVLRHYPYLIHIEGHTDNVPIQNAVYPSNWELSAARAASVVRYLVTDNNLPPTRVSALGFAETRPVRSNGTDEGRAKNRRVEFLLTTPTATQGGPISIPIEDSISPVLGPEGEPVSGGASGTGSENAPR